MRTLTALLLAAVLLTAVAAPGAAQTGGSPAAPVADRPFPPFSLPDVTGRLVSLEELRGKPILLSFWSCHTDTCFTPVRVIESLLKEHGERGLVAPTVCSEIPPALERDSYAGLLQRCGTGQIVLVDKDMAVTRSLGIVQFPTTFLIDRNHTVREVLRGVPSLMTEDFRALVKSLVSE